MAREQYRYLGDYSATPLERAMRLSCWHCRVTWTGCQDAAECPLCGSTDDYERRTAHNYGVATLSRWDNPVPMYCDAESRMGPCHKDAQWIVVAGETVERFLCDGCRALEGWPLPIYQFLSGTTPTGEDR